MKFVNKSKFNNNIVDFCEKFLRLSTNSYVPCSLVYAEYKRFCAVQRGQHMLYRDFRNCICRIDKQISYAKFNNRLYFSGIALAEDFSNHFAAY